MNSWSERTIDHILVRSPLQPFFQWRFSHQLVVLAYHGVSDVAMFEQQIQFVADNMRPVSLQTVMRALQSGATLPDRAALITFDDGERSVYEAGLPVLMKYGVPAVAFVIAELIDSSRPFWWQEVEWLLSRGARMAPTARERTARFLRILKELPDDRRRAAIEEMRRDLNGVHQTPQLTRGELRELIAGGVEIGNHTLTHPCLDRCSNAAVSVEVIRAHELLTDLTGAPPKAFAYPNGNADDRVPPLLMELGYEVAFLFDHRIARLSSSSRFRVSRVRVNSHTSMDRFRLIVSGLHPSLHRALGRN